MPQDDSIPAGLEDGINYHVSDHTKATLVLSALSKSFNSSWSFNNYEPDDTFDEKDLIRKPRAVTLHQSNLFLSILGNDVDPVEDSPQIVKTADLTYLVLSPLTMIIFLNYLPRFTMVPTGQ